MKDTIHKPVPVVPGALFGPTGRRDVATGAARASRAEPVERVAPESPPRRGGGISPAPTEIQSPRRGERDSFSALHGLRGRSARSTRGYIPSPRWGEKAGTPVTMATDDFVDVSTMVVVDTPQPDAFKIKVS